MSGRKRIVDSLPDAGDYSDEDAFNVETDKFDRRKIRVHCPNCFNIASPLCSDKTKCVDGGWRWVFCDHKEPYSVFQALCRKCGCIYKFTLHTPQ